MTAPPATFGTSNQRIQRYGATSAALALLSNRQLGRVLDAQPLLGNGIGGTSALLDIDGMPVFAKRIPLTDLERRAENVMSTANLFELPPYCHYGVGSAGGGVWRELAAQTMSTNWVLSGQNESFPLMYHWRVLTESSATPPPRGEPGSLDELVEYWHGSEAVRHRLEAECLYPAGRGGLGRGKRAAVGGRDHRALRARRGGAERLLLEPFRPEPQDAVPDRGDRTSVCRDPILADRRPDRLILAIRSHERSGFRNVRGVEEPRMTSWWMNEIRGELQDEWCAALDGSPITTEMVESVPDEFRDHGAGDWVRLPAGGASDEGWMMRADFQAFIASQCARR